MKESWKLTDSLLTKPSKTTNITSIKEGNTEIRAKREISNILNNQFCSVGEELAEKLDGTPNPLLTGSYTVNGSNACCKFKEISDMHIRDTTYKT